VTGTAEHHDPFADRLGDLLPLNAWARRHGLLGDDGTPLSVRLGRLRTSAEVRRTRQLGGHLPSAARTNTMQVLWGSYLRADPVITAWAEETIGDGARRRRAGSPRRPRPGTSRPRRNPARHPRPATSSRNRCRGRGGAERRRRAAGRSRRTGHRVGGLHRRQKLGQARQPATGRTGRALTHGLAASPPNTCR
jgi:hypothetical protein